LKYGVLPQGQTLRDILPKEVYAQLEGVAAGRGMPAQALDPMRPWLASMMLQVQGMTQAGYAMENGVDYQADAWARSKGKKMGELETAESQLKIFGDLTREQEIEFLRINLEQSKDLKKLLSECATAYLNGDTAALERLINANMN